GSGVELARLGFCLRGGGWAQVHLLQGLGSLLELAPSELCAQRRQVLVRVLAEPLAGRSQRVGQRRRLLGGQLAQLTLAFPQGGQRLFNGTRLPQSLLRS